MLHLAMLLSEVSGWRLPSDDRLDKANESSHESAITGEVDSARDRRRLAWPSCNTGWCVPKPRPCVPPLRHLVAAFLSAVEYTLGHPAIATRQGITPAAALNATAGSLASEAATGTAESGMRLPAVAATSIPVTHHIMPLVTPAATPAVPPAPLASTAPQARHSWPHTPWPSRQTSPCPSIVHAAAPAPQAFTPPRARHHTPADGVCVRAQGRGRTFAILTAPSRRPRARLCRRRLRRCRRRRPRLRRRPRRVPARVATAVGLMSPPAPCRLSSSLF